MCAVSLYCDYTSAHTSVCAMRVTHAQSSRRRNYPESGSLGPSQPFDLRRTAPQLCTKPALPPLVVEQGRVSKRSRAVRGGLLPNRKSAGGGSRWLTFCLVVAASDLLRAPRCQLLAPRGRHSLWLKFLEHRAPLLLAVNEQGHRHTKHADHQQPEDDGSSHPRGHSHCARLGRLHDCDKGSRHELLAGAASPIRSAGTSGGSTTSDGAVAAVEAPQRCAGALDGRVLAVSSAVEGAVAVRSGIWVTLSTSPRRRRAPLLLPTHRQVLTPSVSAAVQSQ